MADGAVDLRFEDVGFEALRWSPRGLRKDRILHGLSGEFVGGKLSAIMGPSGAGKSTLLRVLAGYTNRGVQGAVYADGVESADVGGCCGSSSSGGQERRWCLIRQDDHLRLGLTVFEAMGYAAQLKIGGRGCRASGANAEERDKEVMRILRMLGLEECGDTRTSRLSGGQKKRLSVALELLDDPPIMFLDEPTTGLDSASCTQCVALLKRLSAGGRTIVCTIHQPSALLLDMFDHLYVVAAGRCVYRGTVAGVVPFLAEAADLRCPPYHNPADFLIEALSSDDPANQAVALLSSAVRNGQMCVTDSGQTTLKAAVGGKTECVETVWRGAEGRGATRTDGAAKGSAITSEPLKDGFNNAKQHWKSSSIPSSSFEQFFVLYKRNILMMRRNCTQLSIRLAAHLVIGAIFGYLYRDVGSEGSTVLSNYMYIYGSLLFLVYTGKMAVLLSFPLELEILSQEHFNRWYTLVPYCLSTIMVEIPFQAVACIMYLFISYILTGQPLESARILPFFLSNVLASLAAQSCGYLIGATMPIKVAVFVGPIIAVLLSVFGFCITYRDTPVGFRWLFHVSYFRYALHANMFILYGRGRDMLPCSESKFYCHFRYPSKFLSEMDIGDPDVDVLSHLSIISTFSIVVHCFTFMAVWMRLHYLR